MRNQHLKRTLLAMGIACVMSQAHANNPTPADIATSSQTWFETQDATTPTNQKTQSDLLLSQDEQKNTNLKPMPPKAEAQNSDSYDIVADITTSSEAWFDHLADHVVVHYPKKDSLEAELDRRISWDKQKNTSPKRLALAEEDKSQDRTHVRREFVKSTLGDMADDISDIELEALFGGTEYLASLATRSFDSNKNRPRAFDFILKDRYLRGRPYQVLDDEGSYLPDYDTKTHDEKTKRAYSSYPSGHTSNGFGQAVAMSLIFPERGKDAFARAIEYGESRVIVGAHFPTDTMTSRAGRYYFMAKMLEDDVRAKELAKLSASVRHLFADLCGDELRSCLEKLPSQSYDDHKKDSHAIGYYHTLKNDNQIERLGLDDLPKEAGHLLKLRYPYLDDDARRQVLASTAYPKNSFAQMGDVNNPDNNWGLINLPSAYDGMGHLYGDVTTKKPDATLDIAGFGEYDAWNNDITGKGRLIQNHSGKLILTGNNHFGGVSIKQGEMILSANNQMYADSEVFADGILNIEGDFFGKILNHQGVVNVHANQKNVTIDDIAMNDGILTVKGERGTAHINQLDGQGRVLVQEGSDFGQVAGSLDFVMAPSDQPVSIQYLLGKHRIMPTKINQEIKDQYLLQVQSGDGVLHLSDGRGDIDKVERGAYAYRLRQVDKAWVLSHLNDNNRPMASSLTTSAMNAAVITPYSMMDMMNAPVQSGIWALHHRNDRTFHHEQGSFNDVSQRTTLGLGMTDGNLLIGALASKSHGTVKTDGNRGYVTTGVSAYVNKQLVGGATVLGALAHQYKKQAIDNVSVQNVKHRAWGASLGMTKLMPINDYHIKPFINIIHLNADGKDAQVQGSTIDFERATLTAVNVGASISKSMRMIKPYATMQLGYARQKNDLTINDAINQHKSRWSSDLSGVAGLVALGVEASASEYSGLSLEVAKTFHEHIDNPVSAKLMLNYRF